MAMKKLNLFAVVMTMMVVSAYGANVEKSVLQAVPMGVEYVAANNDGDVDLYLDCFENAVKAKDMELAAKIANVLYGMNLNAAQQKRFSSVENMISKKDYRVYREHLNILASKSRMVQDYADYNDDTYSAYDEDDEAFVDDVIDSFSKFFNDLGASDSTGWHYERHDTIDGGGFVDVFVDAFGKYLFDDEPDMQSKSAVDKSEIDNLLDDYEKYVGMSVDALRNVMSGDEAALKDFEKYSHKASDLSDKISRLSNGMTSKQFKRYMHIWSNVVTGIF